MPRLPYLPKDISEPVEIVSAIRRRRGGDLINLDRQLLHSPLVAGGWNSLFGVIRTQLEVSPQLRELAMCIVARLNFAEYEFFHHAPLFLEEGGTQQQLDLLDDVEAALERVDVYSPAQLATLRLTFEMTRFVKVKDETFAAARAALASDRECFELITTIAAYNMVSRVLVAVQIDPEGEPGHTKS